MSLTRTGKPCPDLKKIYNAPSEKEGREILDEVTEKWDEKYPRAMKRWYDNWDAVSPIFKFSKDVRTVIYTTNAIESLNSTYRKLNRQRSVFPSDKALLKALYLATFEPRRNGRCRFITGARFTVNCRLCTKADYPTEPETASHIKGKMNARLPGALDMSACFLVTL